MKSSRDDRLKCTSKNDDSIELVPDERVDDAASKANSPLNNEAETEPPTLPSLETSPLGQIPDTGCLEDLCDSSVIILACIIVSN